MSSPDPLQYSWWLASRASGVVALLLVAAAVGLGLSMSGRLQRRPGATKRVRTLHEHLALVGLGAIGVHGLTLLGDRWLHPGLLGIAVPFTMHYRPLATGVGILAGYLAAALGLSYYVRRRIGPRLWRKLHRLTVVVYVMGVAHALTAGTDAATPWLRTVVLATAVPIGALFAVRVTGIGRRRAPQKRGEPRPAARRTADVAAPARG